MSKRLSSQSDGATGIKWIDYTGGSSSRKDANLSSTIYIGDHYGVESKYGTLKILSPFPNRLSVDISVLDMPLSEQELNEKLKRLWEDLIPILLKFYEE